MLTDEGSLERLQFRRCWRSSPARTPVPAAPSPQPYSSAYASRRPHRPRRRLSRPKTTSNTSFSSFRKIAASIICSKAFPAPTRPRAVSPRRARRCRSSPFRSTRATIRTTTRSISSTEYDGGKMDGFNNVGFTKCTAPANAAYAYVEPSETAPISQLAKQFVLGRPDVRIADRCELYGCTNS